jgi:hypothetical protein
MITQKLYLHMIPSQLKQPERESARERVHSFPSGLQNHRNFSGECQKQAISILHHERMC